ncbi:protein FRA10AC1 [Paramormyrops kingsleyae]|uniref:FRA10A associated CGG repeat 1 n=1 Tax=Paramormyrops kingsleyae TaxID=1676925 RepID=A0A3B3RSG3_9TELE|nr:protein FRA10AC1 [Paramormyrops kingsleyae]
MREIMDASDLNLVKVHGGGGYDSDFSDDENTGGTSQHGKKRRHDELLQKPFQQGKHTKVAHKSLAAEEWDREEARNRRHHLISMNAFERHKKFVGDYIMYYGGKMTDFKRSVVNDKTDFDVVRENHRFLWREEDHEDMTWEKDLAKKYYDKLFKEYCISDLSRYKENKFGFRWRTENEVVSGKGQFFCGNKRCEQKEGLKSWEVNFAYVEQGEKRNALVKLRLCPECSYKLNYHHKRKEFKAKKRIKAEVKGESKTAKSSRQKKRRRKSKEHSTTTSSEDSEDSNKDPASSEEVEAEEDEASSETDHWKGPAPSIEEKSREEEFDDYFEDMFL